MNVRFLVLAFVERHPTHGYAIRRWLAITGGGEWTDVKPYSIHHAITTLEREGLLTHLGDLSTARRRVVAITEEGRQELGRLRQELWEQRPWAVPEQLYTLLNFLDPDIEGLRARARAAADRVRRSAHEWHESYGEGKSLPPVWRAMFENGLEHMRADIALLEQVAAMSDAELEAAIPDAQESIPGVADR